MLVDLQPLISLLFKQIFPPEVFISNERPFKIFLKKIK